MASSITSVNALYSNGDWICQLSITVITSQSNALFHQFYSNLTCPKKKSNMHQSRVIHALVFLCFLNFHLTTSTLKREQKKLLKIYH